MDLIIGLPNCEGEDIIYVIIDHFTKYNHFIYALSKYITS